MHRTPYGGQAAATRSSMTSRSPYCQRSRARVLPSARHVHARREYRQGRLAWQGKARYGTAGLGRCRAPPARCPGAPCPTTIFLDRGTRLRPRIGSQYVQTRITDIYGNLDFFNLIEGSTGLGKGCESA